jgi:Carboxypeptidase regulatory-like domain
VTLASTTGRIRGRIVDGLDNPQAGCTVFLENADGTAAAPSTDAGGWFSAELKPDCYSVTVDCGGAPPWIAADVAVVRAGTTIELGNLVQRSRPGLVVTVHSGGRPVPSALIHLRPQLLPLALPAHARSASERRCRSDDEGRAIVPAPPPGPASLEVRARSFLPYVQRLHPENLGSGPLEIELEAASPRLGSVHTTSGAALPGVEVTASLLEGTVLERTRSDDRGAFRFEALPAHALRFTVKESLGEWTFEPVPYGDHDLDLRLPAGSEVAGLVQRPDGTGLSQATVAASVLAAADQGGTALCVTRRLTVTTDGSGGFVLPDMPSGSLTLVASSQERPAVRTDLPALPTTPITLVLPAGCRLAGRLVGPGPLEGIAVEVVADRLPGPLDEWTANPIAVATSDASGRFTLPALPPGRLVLRAGKGSHFAVTPVLELAAGADLRRDLELLEGAVVEGHVQRHGTAATARLQLTGRRPGLPSLRAVTGEGGSFRIGPVPAGDYLLVYAFPDGAVDRRAVSLAPGAVSSLNLVAP